VQEARHTVEQAFARNLDGVYLRQILYGIAFVEGDALTMQQQLALGGRRSGEEDLLLATQAETEAYFGRLTKARDSLAVQSSPRAMLTLRKQQHNGKPSAALGEAMFGNMQRAHKRRDGGTTNWLLEEA